MTKNSSANYLVFKHGQFGSEVVLFRSLVIGCFYAPETKLVCVMGNGGACIPVQGTMEEVKEQIFGSADASQQPPNQTT